MRESNVEYTLVTAGEMVHVRRTSQVSPEDMEITPYPTGFRIRPKAVAPESKVPAVANPKYRLEPEGGLFRLVALRPFGRTQVEVGERGGLVANGKVLSHEGDCWVESGSKVLGGKIRIDGNALVYGESVLDGRVQVDGNARVYNTSIETANGSSVHLTGDSSLSSCKVRTAVYASMRLGGEFQATDSVLAPDGSWEMREMLGNLLDANINGQYQMLSMNTLHGKATAHRMHDGTMIIRVGCQTVRDATQLYDLALRRDASEQEKAMIAGFVATAQAAQRFWPPIVQDNNNDENKEEVVHGDNGDTAAAY